MKELNIEKNTYLESTFEKINEKYDNDEAWKIYNKRRFSFS